MNDEIENIKRRIETHKDSIDILEAKMKILIREAHNASPACKLAIALHSRLCIHNHTDGCGWHYEFDKDQHNWEAVTHKEYLKKAQKVIDAGFDVDTTIKLLKNI